MSRFLSIAVFFIIAFGLILHSGMEIPPFLEWVGELPGDLIIRKGSMEVYAPLASSLLISAVLSFLLALLVPKEK